MTRLAGKSALITGAGRGISGVGFEAGVQSMLVLGFVALLAWEGSRQPVRQ